MVVQQLSPCESLGTIKFGIEFHAFSVCLRRDSKNPQLFGGVIISQIFFLSLLSSVGACHAIELCACVAC